MDPARGADTRPDRDHRPATYDDAGILLVTVVIGVALLTANLTTDRVVDSFRALLHLRPPFADAGPGSFPHLDTRQYGAFVVGATKNAVFSACLGFLVFRLARRSSLRKVLSSYDVRRALLVAGGLLVAAALCSPIVLRSHGLIYAQISLDPFMQPPSALHRRILMPALANMLRLTGAYYAVFFWIAAFATFVLTDAYLAWKNVRLGVLAWASLLTTAMFAAALGHPGYSDVGVLAATILALVDFEETGCFGWVQVCCFGLALMTHETAACVAFGLLALFRFGPRSWIPLGVVFLLDVSSWLGNFGFDLKDALNMNLVLDDRSAMSYFGESKPLALLSLAAAFKVYILIIAKWAVSSWRDGNRKDAVFAVCSIGAALLLDLIAVDYTRLASFSTFVLIIALASEWNALSRNLRQAIAVANLAVPSVYVAGNAKILYFGGLYGLALDRIFPGSMALHPPL